ISLYGDHSSTDDTENTAGDIVVGFYLTPQVVLEFGYGRNYSYTSGTNGSESDTTILRAGALYYFKVGRTGDFVPFIGASLTHVQNDYWGGYYTTNSYHSSSSGSGTELQAGLAYFITESTSLDAKLYTRSYSDDDSGSSVDTTGVNIGIKVRF
ncbi:outer membrane beta-barrel protein, partial [Leptospira sp. SA-E8]|uniref:outer membrane beta-barrel protein n=1 Tax=Leptospira sp. SA-E8 TaxID=3422259 RepID=UPI003EC06076